MHVLLAAGGTAGHIEPALNLPDPLRRRDPATRITVLGGEPQTFTGLPQRQVVTLGNAELALSVTSDIRGFATAGLTNCGGG